MSLSLAFIFGFISNIFLCCFLRTDQSNWLEFFLAFFFIVFWLPWIELCALFMFHLIGIPLRLNFILFSFNQIFFLPLIFLSSAEIDTFAINVYNFCFCIFKWHSFRRGKKNIRLHANPIQVNSIGMRKECSQWQSSHSMRDWKMK